MLGFVIGGLGCGAERARVTAAAPERPRRVEEAKAGAAAVPAPVDAAAAAATVVAGDVLAARARAMDARLAGRGFTVLVEPPFVVAGDEAAEQVARRSATTIRWSVRRLKEAYFKADPREVIEVYLFRDAASYHRNVKDLFDEEPETPYGYYSPEHDALLMNISTGGGTLVHEIVHPYLRANFPACPAWFNEGLASLYEQCDDRDGEIVGLTNWRLPGLQAAIKGGTLRSMATMLAASRDEFYRPADSGMFYAQARYICHYLQEHGLLREFYRQFVATAAVDPSGKTLLVQTVGHVDLERFEADWRRYALGLALG